MRLIAKKPCSFGGKKFFIGEEVPAYLVTSPESQEKLGVLTIAKESGEVAATISGVKEAVDVAELKQLKINVPIKQSDGVFDIEVSLDDAVEVFTILQSKTEEAAERIKSIEKEEVLILIDATESRKGVKNAAAEQAKKIKEDLSVEDMLETKVDELDWPEECTLGTDTDELETQEGGE